MIKAIIYDMDGMLFKEPHFFTKEMEIRYGIPIKDSLFSKDPKYDECKKGNITLNEFLAPYYEKWKEYPRFTLNIEEVKKEWFNFTEIQKEILEVAKTLKKKGILNIIITNNVKERTDYLQEKYNLSEIFEIIGSPDLGVLKPNSKFYDVLKDRFNLDPEDILYYDDKEGTISELKKQGFNALVYRGVEEFREELKSISVL